MRVTVIERGCKSQYLAPANCKFAGTEKYMYYSTMYKNQQLYNVEVLYSPSKNKIYHFLYNKKAMGPLPAIKP